MKSRPHFLIWSGNSVELFYLEPVWPLLKSSQPGRSHLVRRRTDSLRRACRIYSLEGLGYAATPKANAAPDSCRMPR
jgi:hypothetical protein